MTGFLRATGALYLAHLSTFRRSRTAVYWTLAFPLFFLLMFGAAFGHGDKNAFDQLMPGLFTITLISGSLFGVSLRMVTERETGILRRHRMTPVHSVSVVLAHGAMALTTLAVSLLIQGTVAVFAFGFRIHGSPLTLVMMLLLGGVALIPLGLVVGSVARDSKVAPAMTNFLFFPLMFLSGAAIPFPFLPQWMQQLARLVPTTYLVEGLQGVIVRGTGLLQLGIPVVMLLLTSVIGVTANGLLFRWESTEPVRGRRLVVALTVLGIIYVAAFALDPHLHIADPH